MANNKVLTSDFKLHQIRQFIESISEPANTIYYVFAGKPTEYLLGDTTIDPPYPSVQTLTTTVYDEMVLGKQVTENDVRPLAKRYDWQTNVIYDMYDSQDANLKDKFFFVVSQEAGGYYVFKCLDNNGGKPSTSQPLFSSTSPDDPYYETADGYVWKYMYKIDATTYSKFTTLDYIPVVPDSNVSSNAVSGTIDVIKIENPGKNYNNYVSGTFGSTDVRINGIPTQYKLSTASAASNTSFYNGCIIKIVGGPIPEAVGEYRKVTSYSLVNGDGIITIDSPFITTPTGCQYEISPEVIIRGDGRQTVNAVARALVNSTASNTIYKVDILNKGRNYFLGSANAYAHPTVRTSNSVNDAVLRPIFAPKGGHGYDAEAELYVTSMGISVKLSNNEFDTISTDNDFRTIGLLKDPKFSNIKLNYSSISGSTFIDNEEVVQAKLDRLGGSVGVSSDSANVYGLGTLTSLYIDSSPYETTYSNADIITISNVVINAICNVTTNTTGGLDSISIVSAGYGFSDTVSPVLTISNTTGGNTRYFSSRIISNTTLLETGRGYNNSDYITISSTTASANATATITTNSIGGIESVVITNSGKHFSCNEIGIVQIVNEGRGYNSTVNNVITVTGGGGTGAVLRFTNNATGNITSITVLNAGRGYTSSPTANAIGSPTVNAEFNVVLQTTGLTVRIANSTGGFSNGSKILDSAVIANGSSGLYSNSDVITFQSHTVPQGNAFANVVTIPGGTLNNIVVNTTSGNYGFTIGNNSTNVFVSNSSGGNIRFFNGKIVSSVISTNTAPYYKIVGIRPSSAGSGYNSTKVLRVDINDGGTGYNSTANNLIIFSAPGSGTTANAYFSNDLNGTITSVTMVANGTGYTSAPTVTVNPTANGIGANLTAVLANTLTITSTTGGYGAVAYFSNSAVGAVNVVSIANGGFNYLTQASTNAYISDTAGTGAVFEVLLGGGSTVFANGDQVTVFGGIASPNALANISLDYTLNNFSHVYYTNTSFSVASQEINPTGIFFKPDGTRMFIVGHTGDDITQYDLSTAWDVTTSTFVANSAAGLLRDVLPHDLFFTANGTTVYVAGQSDNNINQFSLSQAWNVETIAYVANGNVGTREATPTGVHFSSNGSIMYITGSGSDSLQSWNLSTAWDVTTASYVANTKPVTDNLTSVRFNNDGTKAFLTASANHKIYHFNLGTAWDISTVNTTSSTSFYVKQYEWFPSGLFVKEDTGTIFLLGTNSDKVNVYQALPNYNVSMLNSGLNFNTSNLQVKVTNTTSGNTRYVSGSIIKDIAVNTGGYADFCDNTDILYVTNGSINAVANAISNTTGGLVTLNVTVSGRGFANVSSLNMYMVNSTGGDIRYLNTNVVSSITISDGGTGYQNTDYIVVSSPNGISATANIQTTTTGEIETVQLTNRGKDILAWYVDSLEIVNGGTGYSNADVIKFCGGGGTGANAILLTNSTGGITKVHLASGGINYDCAPTIEIANTTGGVANGSSANIVATVSKPTTFRIYNSTGLPSSGNFADLALTVRPSPNVTANLMYAPVFGNTTNIVTLSTAATLETFVGDSANLYFTTKVAPNVSLNLTNQTTTFDSSLFAGDYVFLQTASVGELHQVNSVVNSTLFTLKSLPGFTNNGVAISSARITARGNVLDQATGYIQVTNASGFFSVNTNVLGIASRTYANVSLVSYNDIAKPIPTTISQLFSYKLQTSVGSFIEDEILYSGNTITGNSVARYHSGNTTAINVTNQDGLFYSGETIYGESSDSYAILATGDTYKYEGDLVRGSGEIIYIENIEPITRSNTQSETIKLILEF